jgi:hypothetical protein
MIQERAKFSTVIQERAKERSMITITNPLNITMNLMTTSEEKVKVAVGIFTFIEMEVRVKEVEVRVKVAEVRAKVAEVTAKAVEVRAKEVIVERIFEVKSSKEEDCR